TLRRERGTARSLPRIINRARGESPTIRVWHPAGADGAGKKVGEGAGGGVRLSRVRLGGERQARHARAGTGRLPMRGTAGPAECAPVPAPGGRNGLTPSRRGAARPAPVPSASRGQSDSGLRVAWPAASG